LLAGGAGAPLCLLDGADRVLHVNESVSFQWDGQFWREIAKITASAATDLRYDGAYAAGSYTDGDIVVQNGVAYLCVRPTTAAPTPWPAVQVQPIVNQQVGTAYTLALSDMDNIVELNNAAAIVLTIPPNSTMPYVITHSSMILQTGVGQVTIAAGAGVTLNGTPGLKIASQWGAVTLLKRATDTWLAVGNLTP
jgi:hypothetical protein